MIVKGPMVKPPPATNLDWKGWADAVRERPGVPTSSIEAQRRAREAARREGIVPPR